MLPPLQPEPPVAYAYAETDGIRLLRVLVDGGLFIFTTDEAREAAVSLGIAPGYLNALLGRLAAGGWIVRLRRGLYAGTGRLPGQVAVHPFAIATHLVTPAAISHWSALNFHGLTEQVPRLITAVTPVKVVTPSMRRGNARVRDADGIGHVWESAGVRIHYASIRPEHFWGIASYWVDEQFKVPITDPERTVLDGFIAPRRLGGLGEVLGVLEAHGEALDLDRLVGYALRYGKASVAKRLGWALDHLGLGDGHASRLAEVHIRGYRLLDPTRPARGPRESRWMIQDNLGPGGEA